MTQKLRGEVMRQLIFTGFVLLGICGPGHASELGDEYTAYQDAAASGDLYAALPHAERAYDVALAMLGPNAAETRSAAADLAYIQNELMNYRATLTTLEPVLAGSGTDPATSEDTWFRILIERGKAHLG